jgi:hypothetical protein
MTRVDRLGVIDCLINASQKMGPIIKIICPLSERNSQLVKKMSDQAPSIQILNGSTSPAAGIFIVDGMKFSRTELVDVSYMIFYKGREIVVALHRLSNTSIGSPSGLAADFSMIGGTAATRTSLAT